MNPLFAQGDAGPHLTTMAPPVKPIAVQDPRRTVPPAWPGAEPEAERAGEQAVVSTSSGHATAFGQGTLGSPGTLNLNLALEGDCGSRWRGHLWAEFACLGVCWVKRRCVVCGPRLYSFLRPHENKDLPLLTRVPSAIRIRISSFSFSTFLPAIFLLSIYLYFSCSLKSTCSSW